MSIEAMKQALEACGKVPTMSVYANEKMLEVEIILRQAIKQAEPVQEPVAWMVYTLDGASVCVTDSPADFTPEHKALPLYTTPPQRKPLTDEEIQSCFYQTEYESMPSVDWGKDPERWCKLFTRAIEAAHGIKENT